MTDKEKAKALAEKEMAFRDGKICGMYEAGLTVKDIACRMKMNQSTVRGVLSRKFQK